jgi:hypothetical protein
MYALTVIRNQTIRGTSAKGKEGQTATVVSGTKPIKSTSIILLNIRVILLNADLIQTAELKIAFHKLQKKRAKISPKILSLNAKSVFA